MEGEAATCVVRPDVDDQALGMLFRTLAVTAGMLGLLVTATELLAAIRRIVFGTRDDRDGMRQIRDFREYDEGRQ